MNEAKCRQRSKKAGYYKAQYLRTERNKARRAAKRARTISPTALAA